MARSTFPPSINIAHERNQKVANVFFKQPVSTHVRFIGEPIGKMQLTRLLQRALLSAVSVTTVEHRFRAEYNTQFYRACI